jgi:hypothetical protein
MSDLQPNLNPFPRTESPSQDQFDGIQKALQLALIGIIVIGGCFTVFLWRQQRDLAKQVTVWQPYVERYDKILLPMIENVRAGLLNYSSKHPDIDPILDKYLLRQNPLGQPATPAVAAPAAVPPVTTRPQAPLPKK